MFVILAVLAISLICLVAIAKWARDQGKLIKENETHYKYSVSGFQKLLGVLQNPYARSAILTRWKIKLGIEKQLQNGSKAPEVDLVTLDGKNMKLIENYGVMNSLPLILNIGSYN